MLKTAKLTVRQKFSRKRHREAKNLKRTALGSFQSITAFNLFTASINPTKKNGMRKHVPQLRILLLIIIKIYAANVC